MSLAWAARVHLHPFPISLIVDSHHERSFARLLARSCRLENGKEVTTTQAGLFLVPGPFHHQRCKSHIYVTKRTLTKQIFVKHLRLNYIFTTFIFFVNIEEYMN